MQPWQSCATFGVNGLYGTASGKPITMQAITTSRVGVYPPLLFFPARSELQQPTLFSITYTLPRPSSGVCVPVSNYVCSLFLASGRPRSRHGGTLRLPSQLVWASQGQGTASNQGDLTGGRPAGWCGEKLAAFISWPTAQVESGE